MKLKTISLTIALAALAGNSQAAVTFSGSANNTGFTLATTTVPLSIVNADITYNWGENWPVGGHTWPILNNDSLAETAAIDGDAGPNGLIYSFTDGASTIGSIEVYSKWANNGRIEQHYSVYTTTDVSVTGSSTWTLLATVGGSGSGNSTQFTTGGDTYLKTTVYDSASTTLAAGITGLKFSFAGGQQNGGVGYSEFDVLTAVPEPSAVLLGGLGIVALLRRRR